MKRRFFVHFEITPVCMEAGIRSPQQEGRDVFDVLADKMRSNPDVLQLVQQIGVGQTEKVVIGVGREYDE